MKENKIELKILPDNLQGEALLKKAVNIFNNFKCSTDYITSNIWTLSEWRTVQNVKCSRCQNSYCRWSVSRLRSENDTILTRVVKLKIICTESRRWFEDNIMPLKPNDPYRSRTAPLTSKRCVLYIYSTNIGTEYFKYGIYSPFFSLQTAVCFIMLTYLVPALFTFYIQGVLKLKTKNNSGATRLSSS